MAEVATKNSFERCCVEFFYNCHCSNGNNCTYLHKKRSEVEMITQPRGEDFFVGRPRTARPCRYFRRGNCFNKDSCMFLHDHDTHLVKRHLVDNVNNSVNSNMPSTSSQSDLNIQKNITDDTSHKQFSFYNRKNANEDNSSRQGSSRTENKEEGACASPTLTLEDSWVNAPEFVPKSVPQKPSRSYAEALSPEAIAERSNARKLCPYTNKDGICRNLADCSFLHGEMCDMCERLVLHPYNEELRKKHRQECLQQHEKNMELSFAIARSKEKSCGVCFEVIMEKATGEQRFGILPNCNHCFCLTCIRKWRQARQFENKIIRACPECRVTSDFVCPSMYWVDTKEDKDKLIDDYKKALAKKDCKYFKKGNGKCPFGNKCFYLHAFPNGNKCDVGPPPRRFNRNFGLDNTDIEVLQQVMFWDFLDEREFPWHSLADDLEDLVSFFTDSEESDWSDYDIMFD